MDFKTKFSIGESVITITTKMVPTDKSCHICAGARAVYL